MDKWVTVTKPTTRRAASIDNDNDNKQMKPTKRYSPYDIAQSKSRRYNASTGTPTQLEQYVLAAQIEHLLYAYRNIECSGASDSITTLTKHLLSTLSDESNPITHSDIYERTGTSVLYVICFLMLTVLSACRIFGFWSSTV